MNLKNNSDNSNGTAEPFASAAALKTAHADLLKRYREALGGRSVHEDNSPRLQALLPDVKSFIERGRLTGALIDAEDERTASQQFLDHWGSVIYRAGLYQDEGAQYDATLAEFDPDLSPALDDSLCPYIGLDAFQEQNHENFFGRRPLVEEMLKILKEGRLLAVVGPSGSGKSSVVLAGLLPKLKTGALPESQKWSYYPPIIPGAYPLRTLALALRPAKSGTSAWVEQQVEFFKKDDGHLLKLIEEAGDAPAVIVIDQFEEVFTLCNDEEQLQAFVSNLLALMGSERGHRVIVTMRIDFEEQMPRLEAFYQPFRQGRVQVMPLSAPDLRDAVERPAESVGLKFEKGIVDKLVKEIVGEPAGLPLLQFTLLELWKRRRRNRVTWEAYNALGGTRQALTKSADEFYRNLLPQYQVVAKRILLRLAWTGEGVEVLRNRVRREELHKVGGSSDQVNLVLGELVAARLVRLTKDEMAAGVEESPDDQFEVAHEALIRNWLRLVQWLQEERDTLRHRIRLRSAAEQWKAYGKDPGGLLGGALLAEAVAYNDLDELEAEFVNASKLAVEAAEREKEEAHRREVEQVEVLAAERQQRIDTQARAARRLWTLVALLTISLLAAGGFAIYAKVQAHEATKQTDEATRQASIAKQQEGKAEEQRLFAEQEKQKARVAAEKAETAAEQASTARELAEIKRREAEEERKRAITLAGIARQKQAEAEIATRLAKESLDKLGVLTAELKQTNDELVEANKLAADKVKEAEEAAKKLLAVNADLTKQKELLQTEKEIAERERVSALDAQLTAKKEADELEKLAYALLAQTTFSEDGKKVVSINKEDSVRVWDTSSKALLKEFTTEGSAIPAVSRDGKLVATSNFEGDIHILDVATGQQLQQFTGVLARAGILEFSPDASKLAVIGDEGELKIIDLKNGRTIASLSGGGVQVVDVAFSPDGQFIATTNTAQENTLIKIGPDQPIETALSTGGCEPFKKNVLDLNASYNLKTSFVVEKVCSADGKAKWKFTMETYTRGGGKEFDLLARKSYETEGDTEATTLASIATEELQEKQANLIGERLKEFGGKADLIREIDQQIRLTKLLELNTELFGQITKDLGLTRPNATN